MEVLDETPPRGIQLPRQLTLKESLETENLPSDYERAYLVGYTVVANAIAENVVSRKDAEDAARTVTPTQLEEFFVFRSEGEEYYLPEIGVGNEKFEEMQKLERLSQELFNRLYDKSLVRFIETKSFAGSRFPDTPEI